MSDRRRTPRTQRKAVRGDASARSQRRDSCVAAPDPAAADEQQQVARLVADGRRNRLPRRAQQQSSALHARRLRAPARRRIRRTCCCPSRGNAHHLHMRTAHRQRSRPAARAAIRSAAATGRPAAITVAPVAKSSPARRTPSPGIASRHDLKDAVRFARRRSHRSRSRSHPAAGHRPSTQIGCAAAATVHRTTRRRDRLRASPIHPKSQH